MQEQDVALWINPIRSTAVIYLWFISLPWLEWLITYTICELELFSTIDIFMTSWNSPKHVLQAIGTNTCLTQGG